MPSKPFNLKVELIKAGAGTGKTTTLIDTLIKYILHYYAEKRVFPRVAVSTFTRKATRELKERMIIKALELKNKELIQYVSYSSHLQISTLHGIFNRFIQTYGYTINFSPGVTIMSDKESYELFITILKDILFEKKIGTALLNHYSFEEITSIVKQYILYIQANPEGCPVNKKKMQNILIDKKNKILKDLQLKPGKKQNEELLKLQNEETHLDIFAHLYLELNTLGKHIIPIWRQKKIELSQITLNDLETMTMEILRREKNISQLKEHKWDFWFLDEYQDTSPIQKDILNQLSKNSQVFIVGDPQQSIYYFRGADASVFLKKEEEVKQSAYAEIKYLKKNYRSCSELVAFFNDFFSSEIFKKMESVNNNYKKEKEVAQFILINPSPIQTNKKKEIELQETANRIDNLLKQGAKPEEIAVLSRQNKALHFMAQYLKNKEFPVHLHSTGSFKHRREVIDALFLLRFLLNPHDDENLIGLLRTPYCRIPDQALANWRQKKNTEQKEYDKKSLWNFCIKEEASQPAIQKIKYHFEKTKNIGIIQSFQNAIESLGFIDLSYYQDPTGVREANLWKLIYCLKNYELKGLTSLSAFADSLFYETLKMPLDQMSYSQNALSAIESSGIQLMTIHAAKGLEFKHIILINVCSGFKHTESFQYFAGEKETGQWTLSIKSEIEDKRIKSSFHKKIQEEQKRIEIQEFDRLLYVALTRAKETITLIGSGKPEKNSWPTRFPFFFNLNPGCHKTKNYSYFVKNILPL